jgi:hypothetical protein
MADGSLLKKRLPKGGRSQGLLNQPLIDPSLAPLVNNIFATSPALARHKDDFAVLRGRPMPEDGSGGQLESYPPEESFNPIPWKATTELFNQGATPEEQQQLITGDMLHRLGAIDATTGEPVDPEYRALKEQLLASMTPQQTADNQKVFQWYQRPYRSADRGGYSDPRTFHQFMDTSRGDEYIMGAITPDKGDYWRARPGTNQKSMYTPEQDEILNKMRRYLFGAK